MVEIELFIRFVLAESIVKFELGIFNCFGHAIHFVLAIVHKDLRVAHRDHVDLSVRQLLVEDGPLLEAHTDFHLVSKSMLPLARQLLLFMLHHCLEVDVNLDSLQLIVRFPLALQLTNLLHFEPACVSVDFDLVDLVRSRHFSGLNIVSLSCHQGCIRHVQIGHGALRNA